MKLKVIMSKFNQLKLTLIATLLKQYILIFQHLKGSRQKKKKIEILMKFLLLWQSCGTCKRVSLLEFWNCNPNKTKITNPMIGNQTHFNGIWNTTYAGVGSKVGSVSRLARRWLVTKRRRRRLRRWMTETHHTNWNY